MSRHSNANVRELIRAYNSFCMTAPVDDDFPDVLAMLDRAWHRFDRGRQDHVLLEEDGELLIAYHALQLARSCELKHPCFRPAWDVVALAFARLTP
jgi:hypothetical protein